MKMRCYHGSNRFFKHFDFTKVGSQTSDMNGVNIGACFTSDKGYAASYAENASGAWNGSPTDGEPTILYAHIEIFYPYEATNTDLESACTDEKTSKAFRQWLIDEGYDSIINHCTNSLDEYICLFPEQIKIICKSKI